MPEAFVTLARWLQPEQSLPGDAEELPAATTAVVPDDEFAMRVRRLRAAVLEALDDSDVSALARVRAYADALLEDLPA